MLPLTLNSTQPIPPFPITPCSHPPTMLPPQELQEETCISSVDVVAEIPRWLHYEFPTSVRCKLQGTWAQYRGQAQRWFLLKYTGQDDAEINLETEHREFAEWRWMPLHELPDSVISFKQEVYREVVAEFGPIIEAHVKSEAQQQ